MFQPFDHTFALDGKVFIVTGGVSGIGKAITEYFIERGAKGVIADMSPKTADFADSLGIKGIQVDLTESGAPEKAVQFAVEQYGKLNIVVNCAGIGPLAPAESMPEEMFDRTLAINLRATYFLAAAGARQMIRQGDGGRIINIASQAGIVAIDGHIAYSTSKAGIIGMTRVLAYEWGKYGITVNAVSPTVINTELSTGGDFWVGERAAEAIRNTPVGRFGETVEVAALCNYLASDASALVTGANYVIDGGYTIH